MKKIPILRTVSAAYGFLIGDFLTILRLSWAPLLAAAALQYVYGRQIVEGALAAAQAADESRTWANMPAGLLLQCVGFLATIIVIVALLRVVIYGDRKPGLFVYLWFGGAELRLVAVYVLLIIAAMAAITGVAIVFILLAAMAAALPWLAVVLVVAIVALAVAVIWIAVRLSLIAPVIVAESGLGVERSWELMRGNVLRYIAAFILAIIPFAIVMLILNAVFLSELGSPFPEVKWTGDFQSYMQEMGKTFKAYQIVEYTATLKNWEAVNIISTLTTFLGVALNAGLTGAVYRMLAGQPDQNEQPAEPH